MINRQIIPCKTAMPLLTENGRREIAYNCICRCRCIGSLPLTASKLNGIVQITANANAIEPAAGGISVQQVQQPVTFIPYYAWANRSKGQMQMWLPRKILGLRF